MAVRQDSSTPFAFAGLFESRGPATGLPVETMAIITTAANETVAPIHSRMPVILDSARAERWIDPDTAADALVPILAPCPAEWLTTYTVSRKVNAPAFDDPG